MSRRAPTAGILGILGAVALAVPSRPSLQQRRTALDDTAPAFALLGIPSAFVGSGAAYVVGRAGHRRPNADAELHPTLRAATRTPAHAGLAGVRSTAAQLAGRDARPRADR